jgi:hypothetical protein
MACHKLLNSLAAVLLLVTKTFSPRVTAFFSKLKIIIFKMLFKFEIFSIQRPYDAYWVAGMHDQRVQDGYKFDIEHYELHPKFINYTIYDDYDMALVTVKGRFKFNYFVKPICLTAAGSNYIGKSVIVAGTENNINKLIK